MTRGTSGRRSGGLATGTAPDEVRAFVALGSNLHDPVRQLLSALETMRRLPATRLVVSSALYRSRPMGDIGQPSYINAVAELATRLAAPELLDQLQRIERDHGRVRDKTRWGPRTLDLDLLLYGDDTIHTPGLVVPHPGMAERDFVLGPLQEIAPQLAIAGLGPVTALLARCQRHDLQCIGRPEDLARYNESSARVSEQ